MSTGRNNNGNSGEFVVLTGPIGGPDTLKGKTTTEPVSGQVGGKISESRWKGLGKVFGRFSQGSGFFLILSFLIVCTYVLFTHTVSIQVKINTRSEAQANAGTSSVPSGPSGTGGSGAEEGEGLGSSYRGLAGLRPGDPLSSNAFVELARAVNPAVVNISTTVIPEGYRGGGRGGGGGGFGGGLNDPFLEELFNQFYGGGGVSAQPRHALGSGFIIREDGLIVTNNHVIAGATEIQVQLAEKSEKKYDAKVVGSDERTDIALIKIEGKDFPILRMGSSQNTAVGEWVAAFGNPLGNGHTLTKGVISAKGRDLNDINRFPLIQTDTPINPGNSGGPLVNLKGEAIGVNSAIAAGAQGIGFAIPIDDVKSVLPDLEKFGRLKRGLLGVSLLDNPMALRELGVEDPEANGGSIVHEVSPGSAADKAGFKRLDVIVEFNGKRVHTSREVQDAVAGAPIGQKIKVKVFRSTQVSRGGQINFEGKTQELVVLLQPRPDVLEKSKPEREQRRLKADGKEAPFRLGFAVANITSDLRRELGLRSDVEVPVVVEVTPGSAASHSGLMVGDLILNVNRQDVSRAAEVLDTIRKGNNLVYINRPPSLSPVLLRISTEKGSR